ncbi:tRNA lysidine(34) synthetase TilS [Imhoffiella purpurea]|uniref:tRNA(Ile)-lysidine synthase n=1 Tax=Imhoffiella purpurea TaxID=1249627 RepID=W9VCK1_9GAMM|nr:tRNA lysidine(34) synthetase TilS [Imhoffiella purpurea]EXJ13767.1 tRNA(Ile)-lysidine synthetase [Imhoffiella purpurea]
MPKLDPARLADALSELDSVRRCWVAYSGGLDSEVLLTALSEVRERLPGELAAVHVDHGLHPRSAVWASRCRTRCEVLGLTCEVRPLGLRPIPGESLEALAREARYDAFVDLLDPDDLLLTAHHQDDQAETLLLALLRGGGVQGLASMPRILPLGAGRLVRPLLGLPRAALMDFADARGLDWIQDPSNDHLSFDRNYLRHRVMPLLRARWPSCAATLSRSAGHCAEAADLVDELADRVLADIPGGRPGTLSIRALLDLGRPLRAGVVRRWLKLGGFRPPDSRHLARILDEMLVARADANPQVLWSGCEVRRYRDDLFVLQPLPRAPAPDSALPWSIGQGTHSLQLPEPLGRLEWRPEAAGSGGRRLRVGFGRSTLTCRSSAGRPSRALKKLFQDAGIPGWLRAYVPLVFEGETLIAIAGVCACAPDEGASAGAEIRWTGHPWEAWLPQPGRDSS